MIISLAHISGLLSDFNEKKRLGLAEVVSHVCRKYDNFFKIYFFYSMGIHQAPLDSLDDVTRISHFYMYFYPPLLRSATVKKFMVGYVFIAFL
jgi:UDPglucose--hexose-1-phosphate uridylyltransferase